jgi:pentapeptide repeat protein
MREIKSLDGVVIYRVEADTLRGVRLSGVDLSCANLRGADLRDSYLHQVNLSNASLRGANLEGAQLTQIGLAGALFDSKTRWPEGFDRWSHGAVAVEFLGPEDRPDTFYVTAEHKPSGEFYLLRFQDRSITGCIPRWGEDEIVDPLTYPFEDHTEDTEWAIARRGELEEIWGIAAEEVPHARRGRQAIPGVGE